MNKYPQQVKSHVEKIVCPNCQSIETATVFHTWPWRSYVHDCKQCGYTIMESEWEKAPINAEGVPF